MATMNRSMRNLAVVGCALLASASAADAALLATYTFTSGPTEVPTAPNLTFGPFSRANVTSQTLSGAFNSSAWNQTGTDDLTEYVEFTVTADPGYTLTVDQIVFDVRASGTGPATAKSRFSLDSYTETFSFATGQSSTFVTGNVANFTDATTSAGGGATLRFYGLSAGGASGTMAFDNVQVHGTSQAIPEPVSLGLLAIGGAVLALRRRT